MITLAKVDNAIKFTFVDNGHYLFNGTIEVPVNSLSLVTDESNMATFKKSATNDIFISATYDELGMTKSELETWYKDNMVGETGGGSSGVTPSEVQTMIDESISGLAESSAVTLEISEAVSGKADSDSLATVATSGSYNDLLDKPTIPDVSNYFDGAEYDSGTTRINFYHGSTVKAYIDASAFIVDGMVDDVRIDEISGVTYLVIDFNTASGKEDIQIPLTDIFDPSNYYTKSEVDDAISAATDDMATQTWVGEQGYLTEHQSLSAYSTTEEVNTAIEEATSGKADTSAVTAVNNVLTAHTADTNIHVTTQEKTAWNAKSDFSGSYNDLTDKPTIPTSASQLTNDAGYTTSGYVDSAVSGKVDVSTYTAYTAATDSTLENKANKSEIPSVSGYADSVKYNSTSKYVEFYHGGTGGTKVFEYDASPFIIDGMVDNVEIKEVEMIVWDNYCSSLPYPTGFGQIARVNLAALSNPENIYIGLKSYDEAYSFVLSANVDWEEGGINWGFDGDTPPYTATTDDSWGYITFDRDYLYDGDIQLAPNCSEQMEEYGEVCTFQTSGTSMVNCLVITFNTDAGKQDINIPISDIFNAENYYTKEEVDDAISAATYDMATQTWVGEQGYLTEHQSLSAYSTTEEVNSAITEATSGKVDTSTYNTYTAATATEIGNKLAVSDFNAYSGAVDTAINSKASESDLSALTDVVSAHTANTDIHVTAQDKTNWNAKSDFSGSYNDLTDKPTIPTVPTSNTAFTNDAGYITSDAISGKADTSAVTESINAAVSGKVDTSTFETYSGSVETALSGKQDTLSAGTNITIVDNVISATGGTGGGKAIEAGRGISITTGETADTVSCTLPFVIDSENIKLDYSNSFTYLLSENQIYGWNNELLGRPTGFNYNCYTSLIGYNNKCNRNNNSNIIGDSNTLGNVFGNNGYNYIFGKSNTISPSMSDDSANNNYIVGRENKVNIQSNNYIFGYGIIPSNSDEFSIGKYNKSVTDGTESGSTYFSIGKGTSTASTANVFEIRQNGDIYISSGGTDILLQDHLGGGSVSSAVTSGDTNAVSSDAVYTAMGGLKLQQITQADYDALVSGGTVDASTLYIITNVVN